MEKQGIDVVYVLGTGSRWNNNEIRFSLRAIEKNMSGVRNIIVVGERPAFLQNVIHLPAKDIYDPAVNADANIITKVLVACNYEGLSNDFLFINDDHIVIKPIAAANVPPLHKGDMTTYAPDYWKLNYWRTRLKRTMETLRAASLPALHFDCHTPIVFNKHRFKEVVERFDYKTAPGLTMKSLYGNVVYAESGVLLTDQKRTVFKNFILNELNNRLAPATFLSFNDDGLNNSLKWWLIDSFRSKSRYEADYPEDRVFDLYWWKMNGRPWDMGVQLFEKYHKHYNLTQMFRMGETPMLRKKLEYKLMQTIHGL